ncbi:hypothetical protein COY32_04835 [candidate division WWE3 bacterium CG_4_10_14_0_2_um_filter_41_14]|uniref:Uncharacterized protein n=1 Tax=candidate division WWE3 bacterium CG_4_10_14_0_2_um_filter_41_14 TaxID=1975072 RepID=A0A2M7TI91_UNCKA|nr:MAG: hypothetical protein COY32_04835 [candidate division WWE3 bacterium CG_4_10_14_0_2_um_filter_41_14]
MLIGAVLVFILLLFIGAGLYYFVLQAPGGAQIVASSSPNLVRIPSEPLTVTRAALAIGSACLVFFVLIKPQLRSKDKEE